MDNSDFEAEFPYVPEIAQNPHTLVGKRVVVGGLGKGLVLEFHKVFSILMPDSVHSIDFKGDIGIRKVLLRRKKNLKFNSGLYFRVMSDEEAKIEQDLLEKSEIEALRFQLRAVEDALRSTVDKHDDEISKIQEEHEQEIKQTELRVSTQIARRMSFSSGASGGNFSFPELLPEEDEYDFEEEDRQLTSEEKEKMQEALRCAKESAERAKLAESREVEANQKVNELEEKIASLKNTLSESPKADGTPVVEESASPASKEDKTQQANEFDMKETVERLEKELAEAKEKALAEAEARKVAKTEAAQLAQQAPKTKPKVVSDKSDVVLSFEAILRKERAELQAAAKKQKEEMERLETLAESEENLVQKHEVVVGKMEAMATQLASVETELLQSIAEKQKLAEELSTRAESNLSHIQDPSTQAIVGNDDAEFADASAALLEAEKASLRQEAEILRREVEELQAAASAAAAASSAIRSQLADDKKTLSLRKIDSANKLSQAKSPESSNDPDVKKNLTSQFEASDGVSSQVVAPQEENEVTSLLSRENEMLRQQLKELEERNQALLSDTEAVNSVAQYASDYERMIAATAKFQSEVSDMRGSSSARGMSLFRGESMSRINMRSDMDSNYGDEDVATYEEPDALDVDSFQRLSMAASQFTMADDEADHVRSFPFASDSPYSPDSKTKSALMNDDDDDDEREHVIHNIPLHDDDDHRFGRGGGDIREQSLVRVAALNKDATALAREKKLVDEAESELNAAMRDLAEKVDKGERSPDDDVDQHVSGLAAKLSQRRKSYHASELKLQKDVQQLKKAVSEIDLKKGSKSDAPITPLRRASLKFMQEIQPLRTGSMSRPSPRHMTSAPSPRTLPPAGLTGKATPNSSSSNDIAAAAAAAAAEVAAEEALTFM